MLSFYRILLTFFNIIFFFIGISFILTSKDMEGDYQAIHERPCTHETDNSYRSVHCRCYQLRLHCQPDARKRSRLHIRWWLRRILDAGVQSNSFLYCCYSFHSHTLGSSDLVMLMQVGCCIPPNRCNMKQANLTTWVPAPGPFSDDPECQTWKMKAGPCFDWVAFREESEDDDRGPNQSRLAKSYLNP